MNSLKASMADQISSVTQNIELLSSSTVGWEIDRLKSLQQCEDAKELALKSFSRFTNVSVPTQMWLSSEVHATKTMTALADLQGLVGEWSALRSIAAEIQVYICHVNFTSTLTYNSRFLHLLSFSVLLYWQI